MKDYNPLELENVCFKGTYIVDGNAKAVVVSTGKNTYSGILHTCCGRCLNVLMMLNIQKQCIIDKLNKIDGNLYITLRDNVRLLFLLCRRGIMKKVLLVDGMALLFRAFYATSVYGQFMKRQDGIPTNGIHGY